MVLSPSDRSVLGRSVTVEMTSVCGTFLKPGEGGSIHFRFTPRVYRQE